jgi:hypothetical protein
MKILIDALIIIINLVVLSSVDSLLDYSLTLFIIIFVLLILIDSIYYLYSIKNHKK